MKWYNKEAWISTILTIIVGLLIVLFLGGCKTKEYIKVPEYHTEYVVRKDTVAKTDSVYVKDSVYVFQKGDTVVISKIAYRDRYRNIYKVKLDTTSSMTPLRFLCLASELLRKASSGL